MIIIEIWYNGPSPDPRRGQAEDLALFAAWPKAGPVRVELSAVETFKDVNPDELTPKAALELSYALKAELN